MNDIGKVELVFLLLLLFIVVFGLIARRLGTPYPIVMVIGGLILGFVPGIPNIGLNPDLVFLVVLPPLLYAAAWTTSWRDFRYNLVSILLLAFGLVGFTVIAVALVAPRVFAGFDWRLGFVLGAVVAPTDAIAATSIARRVGLPRRIVDILEGESLINDATGLLALQFATAIVVHKQVPTVSTGILTLAWLTAGGIALGLLVGFVAYYIERRIDDGPIEITLSILIPYAAYLAAEQVHASGVLAVVACGLFLSRRSANFFSPSVRLQAWSVWESLNYVLNGLVFVLIGLQLPEIRASIRGYSLSTLVVDGAVFSVLLILLRLLWVFPGAGVAWLVRTRLLHQRERRPRPRQTFILGWTGMRGVVSLAAALALPALLADGSPFPQRDLIIFLTFCVICVTLVLQGVTLPPLIRAFGLAGAAGPNCEEQEARRIMIDAAVSHLNDAKEKDSEEAAALYEDLTRHYHQRLASLEHGEVNQGQITDHDRHLELSLEALRVERETAVRLRDEGRINDDVLRLIERELDLSESRIATVREK
ncbi:MAG TPA: Na+/H+ antiporter [Bryobacteraceae bacterium]|jgi:Na+/H+ antiporter|nr:Na+/H+ antiporter [Bryobacteraceae bacterium]